jgi:hypothetical protein
MGKERARLNGSYEEMIIDSFSKESGDLGS